MEMIQTKSFKLAVYTKGNKNSSKLALVLPGKLDAKDYPHMHSHVDYLAKRGFFALTFDPPGTWESPGDISLYTMSNYVKAANELIEYFGSKPTFIMGHSFGGSVATYVGLTNPNVTHFAQAMSGISYREEDEPDYEWKLIGYKTSIRDLPKIFNKNREFRLPYSFQEDRIKYDMTEDLKKSKKPKLFILGKYDDLVEPSEVRNSFKIASPPKELFELDFGHSYRHDETMIDKVNSAIGEFLDKYRF